MSKRAKRRRPQPAQARAQELTPTLSEELWSYASGLDEFWQRVLIEASRYAEVHALDAEDPKHHAIFRVITDRARASKCPFASTFTRPEGAEPKTRVPDDWRHESYEALSRQSAHEREMLRRGCDWYSHDRLDWTTRYSWVFTAARDRSFLDFCTACAVHLGVPSFEPPGLLALDRQTSATSYYRFESWEALYKTAFEGTLPEGLRAPRGRPGRVAVLSARPRTYLSEPQAVHSADRGDYIRRYPMNPPAVYAAEDEYSFRVVYTDRW